MFRKILGASILAGALTLTAPPAFASSKASSWAVRSRAASRVNPRAPSRYGGPIVARCVGPDTIRFINWGRLPAGITLSDGRQYGIDGPFGSFIDIPLTAVHWADTPWPDAPVPDWWRAQFSNNVWVTERKLPTCT